MTPFADTTPEMWAEAFTTAVFVFVLVFGGVVAYLIHRRNKRRRRLAIEESRRFDAPAARWGEDQPPSDIANPS